MKTIFYKRARFVTRLPADFLYNPSHFWMARQPEERVWRVGLTKFATRMLGEMVDHGFEVELGSPIESGQIIGWIEGFKAISDLYAVADGQFAGANPLLRERIILVNQDGYGEGWVYSVRGEPDARSMAVEGYIEVLNQTIDKMLEREKRK